MVSWSGGRIGVPAWGNTERPEYSLTFRGFETGGGGRPVTFGAFGTTSIGDLLIYNTIHAIHQGHDDDATADAPHCHLRCRAAGHHHAAAERLQAGRRGQGQGCRQRKGTGGGAGGGGGGQPSCGGGQLQRHRGAGSARRVAGGGQDLRRGPGGAGRGRPAGARRAAAGAAGPRPRAAGAGAERGATAQAGEQLPPLAAVGGPATGQRRRRRSDQVRPGQRARATPVGRAGAVLCHGGGADLRGDRLALDQDRQLRADQHADLPHRR
ncbi:hypothetical protein NB713_003585 [Xanthomonas sacchari]|nr:hypothetical protein [Xanthomonas sacchari]